MARLDIDTGTEGNSATGDTLRTAFTKVNTNFTDLYSSIGSDNVVINTNTITTNLTNGNIQIIPNGTGNIEVDALQIADTTITPLTTNANLTLATNGTGGIIIDSITIKDNTIKTTSSNENLEIKVAGTGSVVFDAVSITDNVITANRSNDNLELSGGGSGVVQVNGNMKVESTTPIITIKRTNNGNVPGISFEGSSGVEGASIKLDGTGGTTNEIILSTFQSSAVTERLRVTTTGTKVTGILDIDGGITITDNLITASASNANLQLDATGTGAIEMIPAIIRMANLPTSDPSSAGQLWNDSGDLKVSAG